ncbi:SulP family inorganic anion transporter [Roseomonas sp. CCTCC AB2023176]|uniref:SulP family inorganic anion transporter n=1 Tax=Roseomonas sp. CCTCC AB2023176 TaxID=3342640 RepID=UPI0035DFA919
MAVLVVLETLATAAAIRELGGPRADLDQDLRALAAANLAAGAAGAVAGCGSITATSAALAAGGRGRLAAATRGLVILGALAGLGPLVALLPQAVLAGVILGTAWNMLDPGALRPLRTGTGSHRLTDAAVMVVVAGVAVGWSLAAAVAIGVTLAVLAFTASMARGVVRRAWRNPGGRSRTRRPAWAEALLLRAGERIEVVELEGALFFGSADAVALHVERAAESGAEAVILDFGRVTRVDLSGARQIARLLARPPGGRARILLAGLRQGAPARDDMAALGVLAAVPAAAVFETLEEALVSVEAEVLAMAPDAPDGALAPLDALTGLGLEEDTARRLLDAMTEERFAPGELVLRRGEEPEALYVILDGCADVVIPRPGPGNATLRVATTTPGAVMGEMGVLTGGRRTADVRARSALRCLRLSSATLARLEREDPAAGAALLRAIARQIDSNLRMANTTIATLER